MSINNSNDINKKESDNNSNNENLSALNKNLDKFSINGTNPDHNTMNPMGNMTSYHQVIQNQDQAKMNQPVYLGYYQNSIPQGFLNNDPNVPTAAASNPANYPTSGYNQTNPNAGYPAQSPYAHLLSNATATAVNQRVQNPNPQFYNVPSANPQPSYPVISTQQPQYGGYNIPGNFQNTNPIPNQMTYPNQMQYQAQIPVNISNLPIRTVPGDVNFQQQTNQAYQTKDNSQTNPETKAQENFINYNPINTQDQNQNQIIPQMNPAINYPPPMPVHPQITIPPNLLSNPEQLYNQKYDKYFEKGLIADNPDGFRKGLILDEPPKFFNPFVPNYGNNNLCYNPFYTTDPKAISFNMNGYLLKRFKKINTEEDLKFFSNREKRIFNLNNFMKVFFYFSIPLNLFYFIRLRSKRFLFMTFLNFMLLPYPFYVDKFIFYNSYLRNFNGYNDEQVDYILTVNSSQYQKNALANQLPKQPINENKPNADI